MSAAKVGAAVLMVAGPTEGNVGVIELREPGVWHGCEWLIRFEKEVPCYKAFGLGTDCEVWSLRSQFIVLTPPDGEAAIDVATEKEDARFEAIAVRMSRAHNLPLRYLKPVHGGFPSN